MNNLTAPQEWAKQEKEDQEFREAMTRLRAKHYKEKENFYQNNIVRPMNGHEMERI